MVAAAAAAAAAVAVVAVGRCLHNAPGQRQPRRPAAAQVVQLPSVARHPPRRQPQKPTQVASTLPLPLQGLQRRVPLPPFSHPQQPGPHARLSSARATHAQCTLRTFARDRSPRVSFASPFAEPLSSPSLPVVFRAAAFSFAARSCFAPWTQISSSAWSRADTAPVKYR